MAARDRRPSRTTGTRQLAEAVAIGASGRAPIQDFDDLEEIGELSHRFEAAWNAYDMAALGAPFATDATFVSRFGHLWRGRAENVARHAEIHATIYRDCNISNRIFDARLIGDGAAVAHVRSRVSVGPSMKDGPRLCRQP